MKGEYYLGLDMGSSSVGWAVTNEKYEILRAHGKTLWGVRLFDSAQTAGLRKNRAERWGRDFSKKRRYCIMAGKSEKGREYYGIALGALCDQICEKDKSSKSNAGRNIL